MRATKTNTQRDGNHADDANEDGDEYGSEFDDDQTAAGSRTATPQPALEVPVIATIAADNQIDEPPVVNIHPGPTAAEPTTKAVEEGDEYDSEFHDEQTAFLSRTPTPQPPIETPVTASVAADSDNADRDEYNSDVNDEQVALPSSAANPQPPFETPIIASAAVDAWVEGPPVQATQAVQIDELSTTASTVAVESAKPRVFISRLPVRTAAAKQSPPTVSVAVSAPASRESTKPTAAPEWQLRL